MSGFFYFSKPYEPIVGLGYITSTYAYLYDNNLHRIYAQSTLDEIRF